MSVHPVLAGPVESAGRAATVEAGVIVLLRDLHSQLVTAVAGARANGATEEQLKPLTELVGALGMNQEEVAKVFHGKAHGKTPAEEAAEVKPVDQNKAQRLKAEPAGGQVGEYHSPNPPVPPAKGPMVSEPKVDAGKKQSA